MLLRHGPQELTGDLGHYAPLRRITPRPRTKPKPPSAEQTLKNFLAVSGIKERDYAITVLENKILLTFTVPFTHLFVGSTENKRNFLALTAIAERFDVNIRFDHTRVQAPLRDYALPAQDGIPFNPRPAKGPKNTPG